MRVISVVALLRWIARPTASRDFIHPAHVTHHWLRKRHSRSFDRADNDGPRDSSMHAADATPLADVTSRTRPSPTKLDQL